MNDKISGQEKPTRPDWRTSGRDALGRIIVPATRRPPEAPSAPTIAARPAETASTPPTAVASIDAPPSVTAVVEREASKPVLTPADTAAAAEAVELRPHAGGMVTRDTAALKPLRLGPFYVAMTGEAEGALRKGTFTIQTSIPEGQASNSESEKVDSAVIRMAGPGGETLLIVVAREALARPTGEGETPTPNPAASALAADAVTTASDMARDATKEE